MPVKKTENQYFFSSFYIFCIIFISSLSKELLYFLDICFFFCRHVVHAKMEKVRIAAAAGDEGRDGGQTIFYVSLEPEKQSPEIQARTAVR